MKKVFCVLMLWSLNLFSQAVPSWNQQLQTSLDLCDDNYNSFSSKAHVCYAKLTAELLSKELEKDNSSKDLIIYLKDTICECQRDTVGNCFTRSALITHLEFMHSLGPDDVPDAYKNSRAKAACYKMKLNDLLN